MKFLCVLVEGVCSSIVNTTVDFIAKKYVEDSLREIVGVHLVAPAASLHFLFDWL